VTFLDNVEKQCRQEQLEKIYYQMGMAWQRSWKYRHKTILNTSLSILQKNRDAILAYPTFTQMDDFHTGNIIVDGDKLVGFIDLGGQ
jgi:aminoglycoside phosphotransferase (APT) family kinase protein